MLGVETAPTTGGPNPLMDSDLFDAEDDDSDEEVVRSIKPKQKRPTKTRLILSDHSDDEDEDEAPSLLDQGKSQSDAEEEDSDADLRKREENGQHKDRQGTLDDIDDDDDSSDDDKPKERKKIQRPVRSSDDSDDDDCIDDDKPKERKKIERSAWSDDSSDNDKPKEGKKIERSAWSDDSSDNDKPKERKKIERSAWSDDSSDNDKPKERKKIERSAWSDDSSDNDKPKEKKKIERSAWSDDSDDNSSYNHKPKERKKIRRPVRSSDDSDGTSNDDDDDDKPKERKKIRRPVRSSDDSDGDSNSGGEEDDEEDIAFQLTPPPQDPEAETNGNTRSMRRKRISKGDLQQIHSETQRIVRESTIRIPYHHPKPLSLDELFSKKPSSTALKPKGGRVPRIHGKELMNTSIEQANSRTDKDKEEPDELPDVLSSQIQETLKSDAVSCAENQESPSKVLQTDVTTSKTETETMVTESGALDETLPKGEVSDAGKRNSPVADEETPLSPKTSSSPHSKQEETSPPKTSQDLSKEDQSLPNTSQQPLKEGGVPIFKTPPPTTSSRPDPQSSQAKRMQRLQDSLNRLKGAQPKLSGGPKITINLEDDEEPSAEERGVAKLKMRYVEHTRHVKKTHQKDVQINIVTKEKGEDGKEDLKHHTFTLGLDKKPEPIDASLTIPGAKLCRLKQNLQAGMREKREKERIKRQEVFQLDNEEGFQGDDDDDDEAELTEGSETEEEEEKVMGGDEDEDADYEPGNDFLDDEAESDDDDDNEMGDEMDDEEEEESTTVKKLKKKSRSLEKESGLNDSDDEISPSRRKGSKKRAMVVDDVEDGAEEEKGISLRLDSTGTDDTDTEMSDAMQDSGRFHSGSMVHRPRTMLALDHSSKTMEMFDSTTNSTVASSDFQVPISRVDSTNKKVTWSASKDTDSSKDSMSFVLPAPVRQDSSSNSLDTSFEAMTSLIPAHQPEGGMRKSGRASVDSTKGETFTPFSRHQSAFSNISSKSQTVSHNLLTLPVEDSQDLFREDSPRLPTVNDSQHVTESQSFHFSFEDETQTQFLDENGLLNLKPSSSSSKKKTMFKDTQSLNAESQSDMEELLGLCSGQFSATQGQDEVKAEKPGPFSQVSQRAGTQANMDELLNLCSGTFTEMESKSQITSTRNNEEEDEKDDDDGFFHIASDPDGPASDEEINQGLSSDEDIAPKRRRRIVQQESDEDDDEEEGKGGGEESDLDSEFEFERNRESFKGKKFGKKMKLANFVEDEAELSGSEADSDENYDAEDEPDDEDLEGIVHEEMGDEDELRNQVNKVHLKTMDDDDARRLRIFKEMYLPDGDLHSDNKGRTRKFRWRHMEDSQVDMFRPGSDGEEEEDDAKDQDTQWRLQRYQREQWLKENEDKTATDIPDIVTPPVEENSQFAKCLRAATMKKPKETSTQDVEEKEKEKDKKIEMPQPLKIMSKRGSFLTRNKNDLAKMASMLKPIANPQGPRSTKNFVFQSAEAILGGEDSLGEKPPKVKRAASVSDQSATPSGPQAKRPRLERSQSQFTSNSVFRHF